MTEKSQEPATALDAEQVAAYLSQHSEFFIEHDKLIPELRIPHQPGSAVPLAERRICLLCERNIEIRHRLSQLMDVAREDDRLFGETRHPVLDLLNATNLKDMVSTVEDNLCHELQMPYANLILFDDSSVSVGCSVSSVGAHQAIGGLLSGGKTTCGVLRPHELAFLFGEGDRNEIGSAAVVSLSFQGLHGVLAIGSPDPQYYKSSLGILFLGYVTGVLARVLPRFSSPLRSIR